MTTDDRNGPVCPGPTTVEPPLDPEVAAATTGLRTGWTTGTCASAAAKAAVIGLRDGVAPSSVEVGLPGGARVSFAVEAESPTRCVVVKDAGDDPDCTDGARMTASAAWWDGDGNELVAGPGVGTVTKPGLGLPVGRPAINPVPRRMIDAAVAEVTDRAVRLELSVPGGEAMAAKTSNERLGIVGGISVLGTTGIVKPFSTASYRASVVQQIDVAAAQGLPSLVLATGTRSDLAAQRLRPDLAAVAFVEVGDFTGIALRHAAQVGFDRVLWVGMVGKITKLAAGVMMTHFRRSKVDTELLATVARDAGAPRAVVEAATTTATARHFYEVCESTGTWAPLARLCELASRACAAHTGDALAVEVVMVDFDGDRVVARG